VFLDFVKAERANADSSTTGVRSLPTQTLIAQTTIFGKLFALTLVQSPASASHQAFVSVAVDLAIESLEDFFSDII